MSTILSCAILLLAAAALTANAQTNDWTWMAGDTTLGTAAQPGLYGPVNSFGSGYLPGGRGDAVTWKDSAGNEWLYGGYGTDTTGNLRYLNDLWKFNPVTNQWAFMNGTATIPNGFGQLSVAGSSGQFATANTPGGLYGAVGWIDASGNLWLFGGWGCQMFTLPGYPNSCYYNGLWEYNPASNEWAWINGGTTDNQPGAYGSLGMPSTGNQPGARDFPVSWTDSQGNFWLFGGYGYDGSGTLGTLNDLWRFQPSNGEWTWMGGSSTANGEGTYGTQNSPSTGNLPGSRSMAVSWTDSNDNFWLFGGYGQDSNGTVTLLNDLWEYSPSLKTWTWVSGNSVVGYSGGITPVYSAWMTPSSANMPGSRQSATSWIDSKGNLWLFGGYGMDGAGTIGDLNDIWEFNPASSQWAWMGGNSLLVKQTNSEISILGNYGTLLTPSFTNSPPGLSGAAGWTDKTGNLWLFGGYGYDSNGYLGFFNDTWQFYPDPGTLTAAAAPDISPASGSYSIGQAVDVNDTTPGATTYCFLSGAVAATPCAGLTTVGSAETVQALAVASGYANSPVSSATYTAPSVAPPTFNEPSGTYTTSQQITLNDTTPGAVVYYAINASPVVGANQVNGSITVASTETITAIAVAPGSVNSPVVSATYTIWPASAVNQWAWMGGFQKNGVWGTMRTPAPENLPSDRGYAATWTDKQGNGWVFGGFGEDANLNINQALNDLWEFNTISKEWTWMGGNKVAGPQSTCSMSSCAQPGVYGELGKPARTNIPGGRSAASTWTDSSGNLWLFGGVGADVNDTGGYLNDLWMFNPSTLEWTWMGGSNTVNSVGVYGTMGTPASGNIPPARTFASSWVDQSGHAWLFGGEANIPPHFPAYNDFWEYDPSSNEWTWMGGSSSPCLTVTTSGVWGSMGTPAAGNIPSCRYAANNWVDGNGNLWLFGGQGLDIMAYWSDLDSMWEFNPSTKLWAWMGGSNVIGLPSGDFSGIFGTQGTPAVGNLPPSRWGGMSWTDLNGNLWLFGGVETGLESYTNVFLLGDLWVFNPSAFEWTWMGDGSSVPPFFWSPNVFGVLGTPAPGNQPSSQNGASTWTDLQGNLWLYGGDQDYAAGPEDDYWEYKPSAPAPVPGFAVVDINTQAYNNSFGFNVAADTSGTTTINTEVSGGFTGTIALSAANLPAGVTASFSPASVTGFATSQVTVNVAAGVTPGDYTFTVVGTSGGVTENATVLLQVGSEPPATFTLSTAPTLFLSSGGQTSANLTLTPLYGFTSATTFACSGQPNGVTCAFNPTSVTPSGSPVTVQMTVSASTTAALTMPRRPNSPGPPDSLPALALAGLFCAFGWKRSRHWSRWLVIVIAFCALAMVSACGGGGSGEGFTPPPVTTESFNMTITGTSIMNQASTSVYVSVN